MGGDEFIVGLFKCKDLNGELFLDRIDREVNKNIDQPQAFDRISFSYGIVKYDENKHNTIEDLVKEADTSMYKKRKK